MLDTVLGGEGGHERPNRCIVGVQQTIREVEPTLSSKFFFVGLVGALNVYIHAAMAHSCVRENFMVPRLLDDIAVEKVVRLLDLRGHAASLSAVHCRRLPCHARK